MVKENLPEEVTLELKVEKEALRGERSMFWTQGLVSAKAHGRKAHSRAFQKGSMTGAQ